MAEEKEPKRFSDERPQGAVQRDGQGAVPGSERSDEQTEPGVHSPTDGTKAPATEDCPAQLAKVRNEFLYLYAEFENYKKNSIKERADLRKYGSERLVVDLLNVLDIFETALSVDASSDNINSFRKGIEMTANELRSVLQRNGIEEIPALGTPFNPAHHEALSSEETADLAPGHVSRVFKKPYKLHERVVRPGQVVVSKTKST